MVCIAAFVILAIIGIFVAILSIFRRDIGRRYWKAFKKAWGCVGKRVTFQKCETNFGEDIKNSILKKVVVKNPKAVKPLSILIEAVSVLIVIVSIWSLVEAAKAGLALWSLGTCNVKHASACSLGAEVCSIDDNSEPQNIIEYIGLWFSDWGEIFSAIPDKFRDWSPDNFELTGLTIKGAAADASVAVDIFDPGCVVCAQSFRAQLNSGFFERYQVKLVPFPIQDESGNFKYANSRLIVSYIYAAEHQGEPREHQSTQVWYEIIKRVFTEQDEQHRSYQDLFNDYYDATAAEATLQSWLEDFGYQEDERAAIAEYVKSSEVDEIIAKNNDIVVNQMHAKGIPTMLYDNKKHTGKYEEK